MPPSLPTHILTLACEYRPGIVAAASTALASSGANIVESQQFWDRHGNRFFMRMALDSRGASTQTMESSLAGAATDLGMEIHLADAALKRRIVDLVSRFDHAMVQNIHHSFLPSFKGAKPYQQAHERGVKLIGATAHYIISELDERPIIEQETGLCCPAIGRSFSPEFSEEPHARGLGLGEIAPRHRASLS